MEATMRRILLATTILASLLCGCGSVLNHTHMNLAETDKVYGGVQMDAETVRTCAAWVARGDGNPRQLAFSMLSGTLCVLDMPFSLVADTLWLRHDLRVTREKQAAQATVELEPVPAPLEK
jgi:uncharacterized protein YceK